MTVNVDRVISQVNILPFKKSVNSRGIAPRLCHFQVRRLRRYTSVELPLKAYTVHTAICPNRECQMLKAGILHPIFECENVSPTDATFQTTHDQPKRIKAARSRLRRSRHRPQASRTRRSPTAHGFEA